MTRLFHPHDWKTAAAGILAGVITFVVIIAIWFLSPHTVTTATTTTVVAVDDRAQPATGPLVGEFETRIAHQLTATQPSLTPIRGPLTLRISEVSLAEKKGARTFARAAGATGYLDASALARGDVLLGGVQLDKPEVYLREYQPGDWNFQQVFYEMLHAPPTPGPKRRITLAGFHIDNGYVDIKRVGDAFSFRNIEGDISTLSLSDPRLADPIMQIAHVDAVFERMSSRTRLPVHAENAHLTFPNGTVVFNVNRANVAETRLADLKGVWNPEWEGYGVKMEGEALAMRVADFKSFAPERTPDDGNASFHFTVAPLHGDGTAIGLSSLQFDATGADASGDVAFALYPTRVQLGDVNLNVNSLDLALIERITGRKLPYTGRIHGTLRGPASDVVLDVTAMLEAPGVDAFTTRLNGTVAMLGNGFDVKQLTATLKEVPLNALRAFAPSLPLAGLVSGTIGIRGSPRTTPMNLDMRLALGNGTMNVRGVLDMTGTTPRYDVTGDIAGVDAARIARPNVPPVTIGARFALAGTGFDPAVMDARMRIDGGFTGWRANRGDTLVAAVRIRNGIAFVDTMISTLATAELNASGEWHFVAPASGAVQYSVVVSDLDPFGPYLPIVGDTAAAGSIDATGTISGDLQRMLIAGTVKADEARAGSWTASSFNATYAVTLGDSIPQVTLDATGRGIGTPTAGAYEVASVRVRMTPPQFQLDFNAQRSQSAGAIEVSANGSMPATGTREMILNRAYFDLAEGRWQIDRPARIAWGGPGGVRVDSLQMRNDKTGGEFMLDGRVLPLDSASFVAHVAAFPLGDVQELVGRAPIVTGLLTGDARVQPPGDAPVIDASFKLDGGAVEGVPVQHLDGTIAYANTRAELTLTAALDTAGAVDVNVVIPVAFRLTGDRRVQVQDSGALSGHVTAHNLSLAPIDSLVTMVRGLVGTVNGTVTLAGTAHDPSLNGDMSLTNASVRVPSVNQTYTDVAGTLHFEGRRAVLNDFRAKSDGYARLAGDITFERLNQPVFNLTTTFDGFRPVGVDNQPDAALDGSMQLAGPLTALEMTGNILVRDGYFIVPQFGADVTPTALGDLSAASPVLGQDIGPTRTTEWINNLSLHDFVVRLGDGVWIAAQEAKVQLTGALNVNKAQEDIRVTGELEGQRGTYTLSAGPIVRRFDITHALVRFQGSTEMNPAIDIDARRIVLDPNNARRLNVDVHIGGTMRAPALTLASADAPNIPQAELLSYLLFGRSTLAVGSDPLASGGLVQETLGTLYGGALEALSEELEQRLLTQLGLPLDVFQVNVGVDGNTSVVIGRQIGDKLFASFESGVASLSGLTSGNTVSMTNDWALRFDYALAHQSSLQFGIEPVRRGGRIQGLGPLLGAPRPQQYVALRRRWSW